MAKNQGESTTRSESADSLTINVVSKRNKSFEDIVKECKVDLTVWEKTFFEVKSYEVTCVPRATREKDTDGWVRPDARPIVVPMYSIKVCFTRIGAKKIVSGDKLSFLQEMHRIMQEDKFKFPKFEREDLLINAVPEDDECVAAFPSSDLHLTEQVRYEDSNGYEYGTVVAANRLWAHSQRAKALVQQRSLLQNVTKLWIPLLGDSISGTVHPEFVWSNEMTDSAAVILGTRLYYMFLEEMATLGIPIDVDCVHGNHPRMTPKMPTKRQAHTNRDWEIFEQLRFLFREHPLIKFDICTAQIGLKKIYDWTYAFEHGIGVRNGQEEVFEDQLRGIFDDRTHREISHNKGSSFDMALIGNLHKGKFLERTIVNDSYVGQNELGQSWRLKTIRPGQKAWGITAKSPRTWMETIDLGDVRSNKPGKDPISSYAAWFVKKNGR